MPRDNELVKLRDQRIRDVYERMRKRKRNGKPIHTVAYILDVISTEHVFISVKMIERVIYGKK